MKKRFQAGFGAVVAIVALVILAGLAAAMIRFGTASQLASAQDILSARALQAAKAGTEWGLFQVFQPGGIWRTRTGCNAGAQTLDLSATTGFWVTVRCAVTEDYSEGESAVGVANTVRAIRITATACSSAAGCPDNAAAVRPGYVERMREVSLVCPVGAGSTDCQP